MSIYIQKVAQKMDFYFKHKKYLIFLFFLDFLCYFYGVR